MIKLFALFITLCNVGFSLEIKPSKGWLQQFQVPQGIVKQYISESVSDNFSPNLNISKSKLPCCKEQGTSIDSLIIKVISMQELIFPLYVTG